MSRPSHAIIRVGVVFLILNGLILISYAIAVPFFVRGVHWLVTIAAVLFIAALPAIQFTFGRRRRRRAVRAVMVLFGVGMAAIIASDVLYATSLLSRLPHDVIYAFGNALFILSLFGIGELGLKGALPKPISLLSFVTGAVGLLTYVPGASVLALPSLLLVGAWSLAMSFSIRRPK